MRSYLVLSIYCPAVLTAVLLVPFAVEAEPVETTSEGVPKAPLAREATSFSAGTADALADLTADDRRRLELPQGFRGNSLVLVYDDPAVESVVLQAVALWQACRQIGSGLPGLAAFDGRDLVAEPLAWNAIGDRRIDVSVAETSGDRRCGSFRGNQIQVFRRAQKRAGGVRSCGSLSQNLAHEIGHSFGLEDHPRELRWQHAIMSSLQPGNLFSRKVEVFECDAVDELWLTDREAGLL